MLDPDLPVKSRNHICHTVATSLMGLSEHVCVALLMIDVLITNI